MANDEDSDNEPAVSIQERITQLLKKNSSDG